jgi:galactokinase
MALARAAQRAENEVVGAPVGLMDHVASLCAEPDAALLLDCRTLHSRAVPLRLSAAGLQVLVIDTAVRHAHAGGMYGRRRQECADAAAQLGIAALRDASLADLPRLPEPLRRRVRHVVTEDSRVEAAVRCLDADDVAGLGPLLQRSHASLRDDFEVSVPELDTAVDAAMAAGALGARMTGGGFGGAALALVPRQRSDAVTSAVMRQFAARGFSTPSVFSVEPSGSARRLEVT